MNHNLWLKLMSRSSESWFKTKTNLCVSTVSTVKKCLKYYFLEILNLVTVKISTQIYLLNHWTTKFLISLKLMTLTKLLTFQLKTLQIINLNLIMKTLCSMLFFHPLLITLVLCFLCVFSFLNKHLRGLPSLTMTQF